MATDQEQLDEVQAAISTILTGAQSMSAPDRQVAYANLSELRSFQKELQLKLASRSGAIRLADVSGTK